MCHNITTISKIRSGELSKCIRCNVYHLEFNNLFFEFGLNELKRFRKYLFDLDIDYWETKYACPKRKRKIPVPSTQRNLILMFNRREIEELKSLFCKKNDIYGTLLNIEDIDYTFLLN